MLVRLDQVTDRIVNAHNRHRVKYWEIIADNLSKAGWSLGWVSALDVQGRTIWIVDAHRDNGKRFVVHGEEKLTAFRSPPVARSSNLLSRRREGGSPPE